MNNKIDNLSFPILWIQHSDSSMGVYNNREELTRCGRGSESFFKNLVLVLPNGEKYTICKAVKIGKAGAISGLHLLKYIGLYEIRVKLKFSDKHERIDLSSLKEIVLIILKNDNEYWDSDGRLSLLENKIRQAESTEEVINIMKKRYFNNPLD